MIAVAVLEEPTTRTPAVRKGQQFIFSPRDLLLRHGVDSHKVDDVLKADGGCGVCGLIISGATKGTVVTDEDGSAQLVHAERACANGFRSASRLASQRYLSSLFRLPIVLK